MNDEEELYEEDSSDESFILEDSVYDILNKKEKEFYTKYIEGNSDIKEAEVEGLLLCAPDYTSLDEYLVSRSHIKQFEYTPQDYLMVLLYLKRKLVREGNDSVGISAYFISHKDDKPRALGVYNEEDDAISIYIDKSIKKKTDTRYQLKNLLFTVVHEANHADQFHKIVGHKINDADIVSFYLDRVIEKALGPEYYARNYNVVSYEFDAEYRAYFEVAELFGRDNKENVKDILDKELESLSEKDKETLDEYTKNNYHYIQTELRYHNNRICLVKNLALEALNERKKEFEDEPKNSFFHVLFKEENGKYRYRSEEELKALIARTPNGEVKEMCRAALMASDRYMNEIKTSEKINDSKLIMTHLSAITDHNYSVLYYLEKAGDKVKYDYDVLDIIIPRVSSATRLKLDITNKDLMNYIKKNPNFVSKIDFSKCKEEDVLKFIVGAHCIPKEYRNRAEEIFSKIPKSEVKSILENDNKLISSNLKLAFLADKPPRLDALKLIILAKYINSDDKYEFLKPVLLEMLEKEPKARIEKLKTNLREYAPRLVNDYEKSKVNKKKKSQ